MNPESPSPLVDRVIIQISVAAGFSLREKLPQKSQPKGCGYNDLVPFPDITTQSLAGEGGP